MLEILFGNQNVEKILFYLLKNQYCYGKQLADQFSTSLSPIQVTLQKLEKAGVLVSYTIGKTRLFEYNPRYPFLAELKGFLNKAYSFLPANIQENYYEDKTRKRPRRAGKP